MGPTERLYLLSLGNQQGNRHVHRHFTPVLLGAPHEEQQLGTFSMSRGLLPISPEDDGLELGRQPARLLSSRPDLGTSTRARIRGGQVGHASPWLDLLSTDDRQVLARTFGLDSRAPRTLAEVARELKRSTFPAARDVRRAVTLLLGPQAVPPEPGTRANLACAVCGAPVVLPPNLVSKAHEHTCGCA